MTTNVSDPTAVARDSFATAIDAGMDILRQEREALLHGRYECLPDLTARKIALVDRIEAAIRAVHPTRAVQNMIRALVEASRHNEHLLQAAREGLAIAKRRIGAIRKAGRGAIAYAEDGSTITAAGDRWTAERHA